MAQLVKHLPFKHEYLSLDPSIHIKQLGMIVPSTNDVGVSYTNLLISLDKQ